MPRGSRESGFTYVALLVAMFLLALSVNSVMGYVSQQAQREREAELLRVGQSYVDAIANYYQSSPGTVKTFPRSLLELTNDPRWVTVKRHLREVYDDPITRSGKWGQVLTAEGTISGVYSLSEAAPIRSAPIILDNTRLPAAQHYSDWRFVFDPSQAMARRRP